jgi:hypothetical protein
MPTKETVSQSHLETRGSGILRWYHHSSLVQLGNPKEKESPPSSYTGTTSSTPASYTPTTQEKNAQQEITQEESRKTHRQVSFWQEEITQEIAKEIT